VVEEALQGVYATTTSASNDARWRTVLKIFSKFGLRPWPPGVDQVLALGGALKAGGYRSAAGYLSLYRTTAVRLGLEISPAVDQALRDMRRSCARGLGAPVRARAFPLELLSTLPGDHAPWVGRGPIGPRNLMVVGAYWMLREIEASSLRAALVEVTLSAAGAPRVLMHLPASKTDQAAAGAARSHGCGCRPGSPPSPGCPAHAAWDQLLELRRRFPDSWHDGRPSRDLPLFPDVEGRACDKTAVVATLVAGADKLGLPRSAPDGSERISGHSLRATGAQGLAKAGLELWALQLLGRWGSDAIVSYVREAHLARSEEWAARAMRSMSLDHLAGAMAPKAAALTSEGRDLDEALVAAAAGTGVVPPSDPLLATELSRQLEVPVLLAMRGPEFVPPAVLGSEAAQAAEQALVDEERSSVLVLNASRGVVHRAVVCDLDLPPERAAAACGWLYGSADSVSFPDVSAVPDGYRSLCGRCLPRWRALRKRREVPVGGVIRPVAGSPPAPGANSSSLVDL